MYRFKVVYRNGKNSLVNHTFKYGAAYGKIDSFVNRRKLGKFFLLNSYYAVFCRAAFYFCHAFFVALNFYIFGIKAANYIRKKLCVKNNGTVFAYSCRHICFYSKFHVIAGKSKAVVLGVY